MSELPADYWLREYVHWINRYVANRDQFGTEHEITMAAHAMAYRALGKYDILSTLSAL